MTAFDRADDGADGRLDEFDAAVLRAVREMHDAVDPVPVGLVDRVRFAVELEEDLEVQVAEICAQEELAGVRGVAEETAKTITFDSPVLTVMITLNPDAADRVRVDGWLAPPGAHRVECRSSDGKRQVRADEQGRFVMVGVPHGRLQIVVRLDPASEHGPTAPVVVTPAVEI